MWQMFIDDERFPVDEKMVIVRSVEEAKQKMAELGCPFYISFDHDLGDQVPTGFDLAKWLVEQDLDSNGNFLPAQFDFYIHSANPVGKANILGLLKPYLEYRKSTEAKSLKSDNTGNKKYN